jgi:hypothetical protein
MEETPPQEDPMTRAERYAAAYAAFVPSPDDNPAAVPYYCAAEGLRAAWGRDFCDRFNDVFHRAFCAAGAVSVSEGLRVAELTLRDYVERVRVPERPPANYGRFYRAEPVEVTAEDVFRREFRRTFPGERINGKLAREKRQEVWVSACRAAVEQNRRAREDYAADLRAAERDAARLREWVDDVHGVALLLDAAREVVR